MNLSSFWTHTFAFVGGFMALSIFIMPLSLLVATKLLRERRTPAGSVSWLLVVIFMPLIGLPLYWLFGNRKIARIAHEKTPVALTAAVPAAPHLPQPVVKDAARHFSYEGLTGGNALKFHMTGEAAYADLMTLIDGATASIDIETYVLKADATGRAILERLIARAKEGIKVRLLLDGFGSFYAARSPLRKLRRAGGSVAFFMPIWRFTLLNRSNLRNHRKIAVFDGTRVFAGGRNIADEYMGASANPQRWPDMSFVLEGPAALHYRQIFDFDWAFATKGTASPVDRAVDVPPSRDGAIIQVVPSGPDVADDQLFEAILSFIFAAKRRLWIVSPYFIPSVMLAQALRIAADRGIDVRIVVPSKSDQVLPDLARSQLLQDLKDLGAKPLMYAPGMVHAKVMLVDDVVAAVGSANFDTRSMFLNFEVSSIIHSPAEIQAIEGWIEALMKDSQPYVAAAGKRRELAEGVARLIAPLL